MSNSIPPLDISSLSIGQRLELIEALWDSIPDESGAMEMPQWHREELERRIAAADAAPEAFIPWEDVKAELRAQS